jgi:hypothetical protein
LRKDLLARSDIHTGAASLSAGKFQFPMREVHPPAGIVEMARQAFRDKDRPVLAARATHSDGEIFLAFGFVTRQQKLKKIP